MYVYANTSVNSKYFRDEICPKNLFFCGTGLYMGAIYKLQFPLALY